MEGIAQQVVAPTYIRPCKFLLIVGHLPFLMKIELVLKTTKLYYLF